MSIDREITVPVYEPPVLLAETTIQGKEITIFAKTSTLEASLNIAGPPIEEGGQPTLVTFLIEEQLANDLAAAHGRDKDAQAQGQEATELETLLKHVI